MTLENGGEGAVQTPTPPLPPFLVLAGVAVVLDVEAGAGLCGCILGLGAASAAEVT